MFKISTRQAEAAQAVKDGKKIIVLAGSLGTSKTFGAASILISHAKQYPNSIIGVGRKNLTEMKRGTLLSFREAAQKMSVADYRENLADLFWEFPNGSRIMFFEIDHTKDREFAKIKSMNLTCAFIDEADAITKDGFLATYGRTGRTDNNSPDYIMLACNPNEAWIKEDYYNKRHELPSNTVFIEFEITDSFLDASYYQKFESAPAHWKKRYLYNDWNYGDDEWSLFKYTSLDRAHVTSLDDGVRYAALDVARFGNDRSVACTWQGNTLMDITVLKGKDDKVDNIQLAKMFRDYCLNLRVGSDNATVDAVGNGSGVVDYLRETDFEVNEFLAGGKANGNYNNKRSEATHLMAQGFERDELKLFDGCAYLQELKKELTLQQYDIKDKVLVVESKSEINKRLGMSPDIADAVMMAFSLQQELVTADDIML